MKWWLVGPSGLRRRVDEGGVLLGRGPGSDWVVPDTRASAVQALVTLGSKGLELRSLGRNPTRVDGKPEARARLKHGSVIELPGLVLHVEQEGIEQLTSWMVQLRDQRFALRRELLVGSGNACGLRVDGWPEQALVLRLAQGQPVVEALCELKLNGVPFEAGEIESLIDGDRVSCLGEQLLVRARGERVSTLIASPFPIAARFCFLPTGGELHLQFAGGGWLVAELPELRARLIATLLSPPGEFEVGEFVPDEVLLPRIWPGQSQRGRLDLNTLVHRTRKDLLRAGIDPGPLLERARRGGGVAFKLARGATVEIR